MARQKTIILSLGGSLIVPQGKIAVNFLKNFRKLVIKLLKQGYKIVIITGGGGVNRQYNKGAQKIAKIKDLDLDWLGISITKVNAELVRTIFSQYAYKKVLSNPNYPINQVPNQLIIASGWKPGCSSDKDAVLWAKNLKAETIINMSDINYVYDKDPGKYADAKPLKQVSWKDFLKIVGTKWSPRTSAPFGPPASKLAYKLKLKVIVLNGKKLKNLENCLKGKNFQGTVIS
ncbi:UMP kinase [Patescibacteria group bacterium]|nr:UMP kinase [Patescibacteria group bacterium]